MRPTGQFSRITQLLKFMKFYLIYFLYYLIISEDTERRQILQVVVDHYLRFKEYCKAMLVALQLGDSDLVHKCLVTCPDTLMRKQLAFILVRQRVISHISCELFKIQHFDHIIYSSLGNPVEKGLSRRRCKGYRSNFEQ